MVLLHSNIGGGKQMQMKCKSSRKLALKLGVAGALLLAVGMAGNQAMAQVTGECANCHTMHNSQGDNEEVRVGETATYAGWNNGVLAGGTIITEQAQLLKTDCVGCHTNTLNSDTIVDIGGSRVPIVFNTTGSYPAQALAGGNFFNVPTNESYGHNVRGISTGDQTLSFAPGDPGTSGCASSCHESLTLTDAATDPPSVGFKFNGCKGCHLKVAHHNAQDPSYRYLGGHGWPGIEDVLGGPDPGYPNTYEDSDWEQTNSKSDHNFYARALTNNGAGIIDTVGSFCAGCHTSFHSMGQGELPYVAGLDNGGDDNTDNFISKNSGTSPWLRHPTNVNIPNDGEYAALFSGPGVDYNPAVPVARDPAGGNPTTLVYDGMGGSAGDQVMCLSCHRAHGSNQPDALRFPYGDMVAHAGTSVGTGCFYCHTTKDDV